MTRKIAYITDIHLDEQFPKDHGVDAVQNWETILKDIDNKGIEEIIFGGDIGSKESNKWFFSSLNKYKLLISLGNHDTYEETTKYFSVNEDIPNDELFYTSEDDYHKFIFLDTSSNGISPQQLDWLPNELNSTKKILLFIHHPVLAIPSEMDSIYPLKDRDKLKSVLLESGKEVSIFSGHYHFEDFHMDGNIKQYVTPSSSIQVEKIIGEVKFNPKVFGYRIIELESGNLNTQLVMFDKE